MIRGTTPTHVYTLPFDCSVITALRINYAQHDERLFCKDKDDCVCDGNEVKCTLTQEDTLKFQCGEYAQVQIKVLTNGGEVLVSEIIKVLVEKCIDEDVI